MGKQEQYEVSLSGEQCLTSGMTQPKSPVQAGSCLADLGVLLNNKVDMSQQSTTAATKADWILGCIHRRVSSRAGDVIIPLSDAKATSVGLCPVLVLKEGHKGGQRAGELAL